MSTQPTTDPPSPRLTVSVIIMIAAVVNALLFAAAFDRTDEGEDASDTTTANGGHDGHPPSANHDDETEPPPAEPDYYAGGMWSSALGLAPLAEAIVMQAPDSHRLVCQSVSWAGGDQITVVDVSPIAYQAPNAEDKPDLILSIHHEGGKIETEFENAILKYLQAQRPKYASCLVITPLPSIDSPIILTNTHDWTYFWLDDPVAVFSPYVSDAHLQWVAPADELQLFNEDFPLEGDQPDRRKANSLMECLTVFRNVAIAGKPADDQSTAQLIASLGSDDTANAAGARWSLRSRDVYEVIPRLDAWVAQAGPEMRERRVYEALQIRRLLRVHGDSLIDEAAASDNPAMRALAARTIGELADLTTDPMGRLTRLAEDNKSMRVRYEALRACRAMPGRRAAGVAQLVEPYPMDDNMRALFEATMPVLLTYGEPIQPDSREGRMRRMPIDELLAIDRDQRDAMTCKILLERTDLPNAEIAGLIAQLGKATDTEPLPAFLDLLTQMNPATLAKRDPLLDTLVVWDATALKGQTERLAKIAQSGASTPLRRATAGALIQSNDVANATERLKDLPVLFEGLAWVKDQSTLAKWASPAARVATTTGSGTNEVRIAALDAMRYLPADSIKPDIIQNLLTIARQASDVDLRFAAIRAINALPESLRPSGIQDLDLATLTLESVPNQTRYDLEKLTVTAGQPVELTLVNPDNMEHNLVITLPGRGAGIGAEMTRNPDAAAAMDYVPDSKDILHHTRMLPPGTSQTLRFSAPQKPGNYDYVCTFPGHYTSMKGVLEVVAP